MDWNLYVLYHLALPRLRSALVLMVLFGLLVAAVAETGAQLGPPPALGPAQLDQLFARIALYPDPVLAQTMTASTFWSDIPAAAQWADQHRYLTGDALAKAIQEDQLAWDPSVLGLLSFPSVLDMMARDMDWTQDLGSAVLTQRGDVMKAIQRLRAEAWNFGYLRPNDHVNVVYADGFYSILPLNPGVFYVPVYDPLVVFAAPRPGFAVATAIRFGPGITIGATFRSWGWWTEPSIVWISDGILLGGNVWARTWVNRGFYDHPYLLDTWVRPLGPRVERHEVKRR